ncbi:MAG: methionine ABC transporter substrate-binding protein [Lactobacillaceae bacterium]|nr:methionine ABC transporter substrate-binding protein [Lactobacillaceae bacterium]
MKKWIKVFTAFLAIILIASATVSVPAFAKSKTRTIKVGIMSGDKNDDKKWALVAKNAKKYGLKLKFTHFTDYSQPNAALANGDIDVNAFQHYAFLKNWNKQNNGTLVSVGDTTLGPSRLYSGTDASGKDKYKSVKDLPKGATIAIANDATNGARALLLLNAAGVITTEKGNANPTVQDIVKNPKNIKIKEVAADQTLPALADADAAVISQNYVEAAGKDINSAIYTWGGKAGKLTHQWINLIAARKEDKNKLYIKNLVKAYHKKNVANLINKIYNGAEVPAWKGAPQPKESN